MPNGADRVFGTGRKNENRFQPVTADIEALIEQNCDAEYCRCSIVPRDG